MSQQQMNGNKFNTEQVFVEIKVEKYNDTPNVHDTHMDTDTQAEYLRFKQLNEEVVMKDELSIKDEPTDDTRCKAVPSGSVDDPKPYKCSTCDTDFIDTRSLRKHTCPTPAMRPKQYNLKVHKVNISEMNRKKKKRSENWSTEEKNLLRAIIGQSLHIIEDKSTKTSTNIRKAQEWKNITNKLNKRMGKNRSYGDVKLAWKRMKMAAKMSTRGQQIQKGGGETLNSSSQQDFDIMNIIHGFTGEDNYRDAITNAQLNSDNDMAGPSTEFPDMVSPYGVPEIIMEPGASNLNLETNSNRKQSIQMEILKSNSEFKSRQLQMLEVEHQYNIKIAELKIKKLQMEIEILKTKKSQ